MKPLINFFLVLSLLTPPQIFAMRISSSTSSPEALSSLLAIAKIILSMTNYPPSLLLEDYSHYGDFDFNNIEDWDESLIEQEGLGNFMRRLYMSNEFALKDPSRKLSLVIYDSTFFPEQFESYIFYKRILETGFALSQHRENFVFIPFERGASSMILGFRSKDSKRYSFKGALGEAMNFNRDVERLFERMAFSARDLMNSLNELYERLDGMSDGELVDIFDIDYEVKKIEDEIDQILNRKVNKIADYKNKMSSLERKKKEKRDIIEGYRNSDVKWLKCQIKVWVLDSKFMLDVLEGAFPSLVEAYLFLEYFQHFTQRGNIAYNNQLGSNLFKEVPKVASLYREALGRVPVSVKETQIYSERFSKEEQNRHARFIALVTTRFSYGSLWKEAQEPFLPFANRFMEIIGHAPIEKIEYNSDFLKELEHYGRKTVLFESGESSSSGVEISEVESVCKKKKKKRRKKKFKIEIKLEENKEDEKQEEKIEEIQEITEEEAEECRDDFLESEREKPIVRLSQPKTNPNKKSEQQRAEERRIRNGEILNKYKNEQKQDVHPRASLQVTRDEALQIINGLSSSQRRVLELLFAQPSSHLLLTHEDIYNFADAIQLRMNQITGMNNGRKFSDTIRQRVHRAHRSTDTNFLLPRHSIDTVRVYFILYGIIPEGWKAKVREDFGAVSKIRD